MGAVNAIRKISGSLRNCDGLTFHIIRLSDYQGRCQVIIIQERSLLRWEHSRRTPNKAASSIPDKATDPWQPANLKPFAHCGSPLFPFGGGLIWVETYTAY